MSKVSAGVAGIDVLIPVCPLNDTVLASVTGKFVPVSADAFHAT